MHYFYYQGGKKSMNYFKENCGGLLSTQGSLLVLLESSSLLSCFSICHPMTSNLDSPLPFPFQRLINGLDGQLDFGLVSPSLVSYSAVKARVILVSTVIEWGGESWFRHCQGTMRPILKSKQTYVLPCTWWTSWIFNLIRQLRKFLSTLPPVEDTGTRNPPGVHPYSSPPRFWQAVGASLWLNLKGDKKKYHL